MESEKEWLEKKEEKRTKQVLAAGSTLTLCNPPLNNCVTNPLRRAEPCHLRLLTPKTIALRLSSQQFGGHVQTTIIFASACVM